MACYNNIVENSFDCTKLGYALNYSGAEGTYIHIVDNKLSGNYSFPEQTVSRGVVVVNRDTDECLNFISSVESLWNEK